MTHESIKLLEKCFPFIKFRYEEINGLDIYINDNKTSYHWFGDLVNLWHTPLYDEAIKANRFITTFIESLIFCKLY